MSIFGNIASQVAGSIPPDLADRLNGIVDEAQIQQILGGLQGILHDHDGGPLSPDAIQGIHDLVDQVHGDASDAPIPAEVHLEAVQADHILEAVADTPAATQEMMESMSKMLDSARSMMEQDHDAMIHAVQNLHSDAGDQSGHEVAVADGHDASGATVHPADAVQHDDHLAVDHDDGSAAS